MNYTGADFPILESLRDPMFASDPTPIFNEMHQQAGPGVFRDPNEGGLVVTRYQTLKWISGHAAFQAQDRTSRVSGPSQSGSLKSLFDNHPVFMNEPVHMPVHRASYRAIAWPGVSTIESQIRSLATEILDSLLERKEIDLVADYSFAISSRYWANILDLPDSVAVSLRDWAQDIGTVLAFGSTNRHRERADAAAQNMWTLIDQQYASISSMKRESTFGIVDTLLKDIEIDNKPKDAAALLAAMTFDGVDGGGGMTSNFLACLLSNQDAMNALRADRSLIPSAWIEATRVAPAILGLFRCPIEDIQYEDVRFPVGTNILMLNAAGNRDPAVFTCPDLYDIRRQERQPLSFGGGGRACVGRMLAKIQGEIAFQVLLDNVQSIELVGELADWGPPGLIRTIKKVPVRLAPF